ncbi:unnamed protein product [Mesocestoides corti]|uniref:Uncharacterized protein n=1 Tax=Mesocestoides corti TaxID=53468 RepID=A0A0R3UPW0_MESCO|nr:unnamed protein product [Mesocestoides corti]
MELFYYLRSLSGRDLSDEDRVLLRLPFLAQIVLSLKKLLRDLGNFEEGFNLENTIEDAQLIFRNADQIKQGNLSTKVIAALKNLRQDNAMQSYLKVATDQAADSSNYFFSSLERLIHNNFVPSEDDMLHIKCGSCGIAEETITHVGDSFRFICVFTNRSSIKKWVHFFEEVDAIIFIASLVNYDEPLIHDPEKLRLRDDMAYFESICNSKWFGNCSQIVLILNKFDLFTRKIATSPLKICFPDYRGSSDPMEAAQFIQKKFEALNRNPLRTVHSYITSVRSKDSVKEIVDAIINLTAKSSKT